MAAPLLREHRLYQADWLLRYYGFSAHELLDEASPNLDPELDPKTGWALRQTNRIAARSAKRPCIRGAQALAMGCFVIFSASCLLLPSVCFAK